MLFFFYMKEIINFLFPTFGFFYVKKHKDFPFDLYDRY
jgi:hypothetical protein